MKYKVTKMDRRYTRHGYQYLIEFSKVTHLGTGVLDFDRTRRWFTQQFGWSQDVEVRAEMIKNRRYNADMYEIDDINAVWAYCVKYGDYRIYVDNDKTMSWFLLCHPISP
jgi:hypothetical protein